MRTGLAALSAVVVSVIAVSLAVPAAATTSAIAAPGVDQLASRPAAASLRQTPGRGTAPTWQSASGVSLRDDPLFLVMDTSGSMSGDRLRAAKASAMVVIGELDPSRMYGLYQYPAGKKQVDGCSVGRWLTEPGRVSYASARGEAAGLKADGGTPTGPALLEFARSLEVRGVTSATAVLVSDGEANCGDTDVCAIATVLKQKQIRLVFNTVSFDNTLQGDAQMACLASATGGRAFTVDQTQDLVAAISAAAAYAATVTADVPGELPVATGESSTVASDMTIEVTNTGTTKIPDALLTITFNSPDPAARRVRVPTPLIRLGNLGPGASTTRTVRLFPEASQPGPVTWKASLSSRSVPVAVAEGTVEVSTDSSIRSGGPILADAKNVVILGDSYSSGEGAGSYDAGQYERCHRSSGAWGRILYPNAHMIACSGAVTTDLTAPNHANHDLEAQLISLARVAADSPPDLVMFTLGGNDAGFEPVLKECAIYPHCLGGGQMTKVKWDGLQASLEKAYRNINAIVNAPSVIARRGGFAQIVVLPYMRALPRSGGEGCAFGISSAELPLLNSFQNALNATVTSAVTRTRVNDGVPIHLAEPVSDVFLPDHTICDDDPDLKVPTIATWWEVLPLVEKQELFHPNSQGQAAIAASLVEWSRTVKPLPLGKSAAPYDDIKVVTSDWIRRSTSIGTHIADSGHPEWVQTTKRLTDLVSLPQATWATEPGAEMIGVPGCTTATCGYDSGPIFVTAYSTPVPLGILEVDRGNIHGSVTLPLDLTPGIHTLAYEGRGIDGKPRIVKVPIRVWRQGAGAAFIGVAAGLVLALVGASMLWRSRRSTQNALADPRPQKS